MSKPAQGAISRERKGKGALSLGPGSERQNRSPLSWSIKCGQEIVQILTVGMIKMESGRNPLPLW